MLKKPSRLVSAFFALRVFTRNERKNVFYHTIILLIVPAVTYDLNWLAWVTSADTFQESGQFVVPVIAVVSTILSGLSLNWWTEEMPNKLRQIQFAE